MARDGIIDGLPDRTPDERADGARPVLAARDAREADGRAERPERLVAALPEQRIAGPSRRRTGLRFFCGIRADLAPGSTAFAVGPGAVRAFAAPGIRAAGSRAA